MGGGSSAKTPEASEIEKAQYDIGIDGINNYNSKYAGLEQELVNAAGVDRSPRIQGRVNADTQMGLAGASQAAVARGTQSGGLGSGASLGVFDAGQTGSALAQANSEGLMAGKDDQRQRKLAATGAVQDGQNMVIGNQIDAAEIANRNLVNKFLADSTKRIQNIQGVENVLASGFTGYNQGQMYAQNQQYMNALQENLMSDPLGTPATNLQYGPSNRDRRTFQLLYGPPRRLGA
jgi:hypothetical protein